MIDANEYYLKKHEADMVEDDSAAEAKEKEIEENFKTLLASREDFYVSVRESMHEDTFMHQALHKFYLDKNFGPLGKLFYGIVEQELRAEAERMAN